jgi:precorrin-6B methylase 1
MRRIERMALSKDGKSKFVVIENAGMENEYIREGTFDTITEASKFIDRQYTKREVEVMNVRISLKLSDGTISTEF